MVLAKFFEIIVFITKYDKITPFAPFGSFWTKLVQSVTNRERFTNFKTIVTNPHKIYYVGRQTLQSVTGGYYVMWQVLQSATIITKWDVTIEI